MRSTKLRLKLIVQFGNACQRCGYNKCIRALHFHHIDSTHKKDFSGTRGGANPQEVQQNPDRFLLLCANCHIEEHDAQDKAKATMNVCRFCNREFRTKPYLALQGKGNYCSKACVDKHREEQAQSPEYILNRFWKNVSKQGDCWIWTNTISKGVPVIQMKVNGKYTFLTCPRFAYEQFIGPIDKGIQLRKKCESLYCVNPNHFELSSEYGSKSAQSKLTESQVREIRRKFATGAYTHASLAAEYNIRRETIGQIVRYQRWAHVQDSL